MKDILSEMMYDPPNADCYLRNSCCSKDVSVRKKLIDVCAKENVISITYKQRISEPNTTLEIKTELVDNLI